MNTKQIGDISQLMLLARLAQSGETVLLPYGDNEQYDVVIDRNGCFSRIQCKTGRLRRGCIKFDTCSSYRHRGRGKKPYTQQAEFFGVYCPENDKCYLVPVSEVGITSATLRVDPPRNGWKTGIRWAKDYEIKQPE